MCVGGRGSSEDSDGLLLYLSPAFHHLTKKAQLLGYETEVIGQVTETRRMVPPRLTCDFVNYFHGEHLQQGVVSGISLN